jgi:hypothetical protein
MGRAVAAPPHDVRAGRSRAEACDRAGAGGRAAGHHFERVSFGSVFPWRLGSRVGGHWWLDLMTRPQVPQCGCRERFIAHFLLESLGCCDSARRVLRRVREDDVPEDKESENDRGDTDPFQPVHDWTPPSPFRFRVRGMAPKNRCQDPHDRTRGRVITGPPLEVSSEVPCR